MTEQPDKKPLTKVEIIDTLLGDAYQARVGLHMEIDHWFEESRKGDAADCVRNAVNMQHDVELNAAYIKFLLGLVPETQV